MKTCWADCWPRIGGIETVERLAALSGSDFTSVMLEVVRRRASRETPASVLRRYERDRFVRPSDPRAVRRAEDTLLGGLPDDVEVVTLAPVVPLGTHSAVGPVSQDKVVSTVRACEVAADPTNALALEAASPAGVGPGTARPRPAGGGSAGGPARSGSRPGCSRTSGCSAWSRPGGTRAACGSSGPHSPASWRSRSAAWPRPSAGTCRSP